MIYVFGAGGFACEIYQWMLLEGQAEELAGFVVDDARIGEAPSDVMGLPVRPVSGVPTPSRFVLGLSSPRAKRDVVARLRARGWEPASFISRHSLVSPAAEIGEGVVVCPFTTVSPFADVGPFVTVNCRSGIGHHARVGAFATLLGNNAVNGNATIGADVTLGAGAVVHPGLRVGERSTVGMGAVVIRSVPDGSTVFGNPARRL